MNTDSYVNYIDNLNASYREVFDKVTRYVGLLDGLSEEHKNEKLNDLLDLMLSAQEAGKPVEKVCGKDVGTFCREFCAEYDIRFAIYEILKNGRFLIGLLLLESLMWAFGWFVDETVRQGYSLPGLMVQTEINNFILVLTVAEFVGSAASLLERHRMFRKKQYSNTAMHFGIRLAAGICAIIIIILTVIHKLDCVSLPLGILLPFCLIWLGASYWMESMLKDEIEESSFRIFSRTLKNEIPQQIDERFPIAMEKKYMTIREKKQKKGIVYTMENFLKDEERESMRMLKLKKFYMFLPLIMSVIVLFSCSGMWADAPVSAFACVLVTFVAECLVMFLIWRMVKGTVVQRMAWIRRKRENL